MLLTQAGSSQWPRVILQAGLSLPLKFHAWFNRVPDFKEVPSAWIGWEEHKEVQMCSKIKTATAFVSIREKASQPQEEQSPHFVLRRTNTVPGKVPEISTLVSSENGGGGLGAVLKETFPSLCFLPASPAGPVPPPRAANPPWTLLCGQMQWKPTINWDLCTKGTSGSRGWGQKGDSAQEGAPHSCLGRQGRPSPLPAPTVQPASNHSLAKASPTFS